MINHAQLSSLQALRLYLRRQASSPAHYGAASLLSLLFSWIPTPIGMFLRALAYRALIDMEGLPAIESGVRIQFPENVRLGRRAYLDHRVYLHACPQGIEIGSGTCIMYGSVLHVYNFRDLPNSKICIGRDCLVGEYNVLRGQGGIEIGDRVFTSPFVQILAVNHVFEDTTRPFVEQGITARGIRVHDDVWIGAGAILTDGVEVGGRSVVAAGTVVTRDIPERTLFAGVPGKVVRELGESNSEPPYPIYH